MHLRRSRSARTRRFFTREALRGAAGTATAHECRIYVPANEAFFTWETRHEYRCEPTQHNNTETSVLLAKKVQKRVSLNL
jgi:hypothetical protein